MTTETDEDTERWLERAVYAHEHPGFTGYYEFTVSFEMFGQRFSRQVRAKYAYSPEWEYFDLFKNALFTSTGGHSLSFEILAIPADDPRHLPDPDHDASDEKEPGEDGQPHWVEIDLVGIGVLPLSTWEKIDDAIDAQCKEEGQTQEEGEEAWRFTLAR